MNELKKKFTVNVSIAVLLVALFMYVGAEYFLKEVESSSAQIVSDKQKIYTMSAKNASLGESKKQYEETKIRINEALESVIDEDKTVLFIEEAEKTALADKVKLNIKIKTPPSKEEKAESDPFSSASFSFTAGGTFNNVMRFLGEMENFKYCSDIENVKMEFSDFDEYNKDMILLTFDVKLYQKDSQK